MRQFLQGPAAGLDAESERGSGSDGRGRSERLHVQLSPFGCVQMRAGMVF
jgi:hypothetical protein